MTYCYSKETFTSERFPNGRPFNTGCYLSDTGQDVTLAVRNVLKSTDVC